MSDTEEDNPIAAIVLAIRRSQMERDCKAVCVDCEHDDPVSFSEERNIFEHEKSGRECDAFGIREAFAEEHGK